MMNPQRFLILGIAAILGWGAMAWAAYPEPTNLNRPEYDYSNADSCPTCHFIDGLDHMARAAGVMWNSTTNQWERTGHGWWDAHHSQSRYGSTDNTFCAFCHSPLQADGTSYMSNGQIIGAQPVTDFQAVTCSACHPSNTLAAVILKANPTAVYGGEVGTLIRGQDPTKVTSWIPLLAGQEDNFCLTCHEQRHNTDNPAFEAMYGAGVKCVDCHMAPYRYITFSGVTIPEVFHDWKVGENLPYSCGVQGSIPHISGISSCHSEFTVQSTQALIPFMKQQHSDWWNLPPFASSATGAAAPISAHSLATASDYLDLWRQIQAQQQKK